MNTPPPLTPARARWVLFVTILASSVVFIDMTIVNLALPAMQLDTGSSFRAMQWVVEAYVLFLTALMLTGGGLADAFGRRRMMCTGAVIFGIASIGAGLSDSAGTLIAARALQGVGGALLAPASLAIVSAAFPPEQRGRALGLWAAFLSCLGRESHHRLGGLLIEVWSWRAVFFVNVPLLALVLLIAPWHISESADLTRGHKVDWWGSVTADCLTWIAHVCVIACRGSRAWRRAGDLLPFRRCGVRNRFRYGGATRAQFPMLPLSMFASRRFSGLNLMTLVLFTAVGAVMFLLPMVLIQSLDYSPLQAGAALAPSMLVMFIIAPQIGRFTDRFGPRLPLVLGPCLSALSYVLLANTTDPLYLSGVLVPNHAHGIGIWHLGDAADQRSNGRGW